MARVADVDACSTRCRATRKVGLKRGRRRGACPRETRVHDMDTRCKRRDGAWVVETCDRDEQTHRRWEGGKWRRRFCDRAAPLLSDRSAKTVTPRGGRASTPGRSRRGRAGCAARARNAQPRDGWAVGETKKNERTSHGECAPSSNRGSTELRRRPRSEQSPNPSSRSRTRASTACRTTGCAFRSAPRQVAPTLTSSVRYPQPFR